MFEITIKDTVYKFKFGIGFVKEIDKKFTKPIDGVPGRTEEIGLDYYIAKVLAGDVIALVDVLELANKYAAEPRITKRILEDYLEDEDTDIDRIFEDTISFFEKSNATKKRAAQILEAVRKASE